MMNYEYIKEIDYLIHKLLELKDSTIISKTYHEELEEKIKKLAGDITYWLKVEKKVKEIKK